MLPVVSLITCTIGRPEPLSRLLSSLMVQTDRAFELIVVDQSRDQQIAKQLADTPLPHIRHLRSERGLSRGRNIGLQHARGEIIGFPDDDCWYHQDVIDHVHRLFQWPDLTVLTGRTVDGSGVDSVSAHRSESGVVNRHNVFESGNSNTLFARTSVARDVGGFDERLGVGAPTPFQSGEETDFLLRCIKANHQPRFIRDFVVHHDQTDTSNAKQMLRYRSYSSGYGRILRQHGYGTGYMGTRVGRAALRAALCLARGDSSGARQRYHWIRGTLRGFLMSAPGR